MPDKSQPEKDDHSRSSGNINVNVPDIFDRRLWIMGF